jgi:VWFA-related protein
MRNNLKVIYVLCVLVGWCLSTWGQIDTLSATSLINFGGGAVDAQFRSMDFAQKMLQEQNKSSDPKVLAYQKELVDSGMVSGLDLAAPAKAVKEFNRAISLLRGQHSGDAIGHLQKAVTIYPRFVSAHNYLGLAYLDEDDTTHAQSEFEAAATLDPKFAGAFLNLGRLALSQNNYTLAGSHLQKAAAIRPADPSILTALAYVQHGSHQYRDAIETVRRLHSLPHPGKGNAHYIAAVAAVALNDFSVARSELALFLQEDPSNPLAPIARYNLDILKRSQPAATTTQPTATLVSTLPRSLANSDRLKAQLSGVEDESEGRSCDHCAEPSAVASDAGAASIPDFSTAPPDQWTIRKVVDEVAVFFGVSSGGHVVTDLDLSDIKVRDDNKPPEKVLQFNPQSKLPLRLGVLIDTSGSVQRRFSFEKLAAARFLQQMLSNPSDLGFVAGFAENSTVTQDFTGDQEKLVAGVNKLPSSDGGTALFDAVSLACWKLEAYPEHESVARVLVVVTDGEDNFSHTTLRQTIRDEEASGVTVYTISTQEGNRDKTDADEVLRTLAGRSGGEALFPGMTLGKSFDKLRDQIRSRYLIAYKPADFEPNGKYRTISIVAEKNGKHLQVHARRGYHARVEGATP